MAQVFALPDLGEGLTEASIVAWHVAVGDEVAVDQAIAEVETAKSIVELPSPFAGVVAALHGGVGDVVTVGAPFFEVAGAADSSDTHELEGYRREERAGVIEPVPAAEAAESEGGSGGGSGNVLIGYGTSSHAGAVRRRRAVAGSVGSAVGNVSRATTAPASGPVAVKSPIVRQLARDLGVDVRAIVGTGVGGLITRADVLAAAPAAAANGDSAAPATAPSVASTSAGSVGRSIAPTGLAEASREAMSVLRRTVSAKLSTSRREIPEATVWVDVDVTDLWAMRRKMALGDASAPSFTALAARFVLMALREYPLLASRIDGDDIVTFDGVNLGVATDTDRGLMVPVIERADRLTVGELDAQLREVAAEARTGRLAPAKLTGSTITLNNYGALGVDGSAAIINHPEVAIIGMGRAIERAWVVDGQIVPRRIVQLSLVFDHRVCDGGYAAGFLHHLVTSLENPAVRFREV